MDSNASIVMDLDGRVMIRGDRGPMLQSIGRTLLDNTFLIAVSISRHGTADSW